jgi:hypothetical protein
MEASTADEQKGGFLDLSRLTVGELLGMVGGAVMVASLWLPWFSTSDANENSVITSAGIGPGESATAWQTFPILRWALIAGASAPFILSWIVARGHSLTWKPGEVTMIVGLVAFVLILCNGIVLGKPDPGIEISLARGYAVGIAGAVAMTIAGFLRQALHSDAKKPPGVL